jgi:succinate dehydrogenase/fumarate reductase flavoprotein subunit
MSRTPQASRKSYIQSVERALDILEILARAKRPMRNGEIAKIMNDCLGITRTKEKLTEGIDGIDYFLSVSDKLIYDSDISPYVGYSIRPMLILARAILQSALERKETRGAHIRSDYPERSEEYELCSVCTYQNGEHCVSFEKEDKQ